MKLRVLFFLKRYCIILEIESFFRKDTVLFLRLRVFFLKRYCIILEDESFFLKRYYIILEFESLFSEKILYYS